ncbi:hypothetical protein AHAS_Ahas16G0258900 [Arachis hypogaea]
MQSGRYPYYAVRKGKSPGIYTTWKECEQQVVGFRNNEYKGFRVFEEAQSWLRAGESCFMTTFHRMEKHGLCGQSNMGTNGSTFIHVEDMELMLLRICALLHIGSPIYVPQPPDSKGGGLMFRYTVVLPENGRGLDLVVYGPAYADERSDRQEVAFLMLEPVLGATGYKIHDYNYRVMVCMQDPHESSRAETVVGLRERVRVLEEENAELHLMENVSTTQALQASQARTLKTLSDCITSHGKILEILWEEYADRRRKQYPQAGIEPCKADWPGKKEAVIANKGMTTSWGRDGKLDFDSSDDEHGREVLGENLGDVTPLLFEIKKDGLLSSEDMPKFLDVDFRPPKGIKFIATELAVAAYIFARDLEQGEILYSGEHCHGARHAFWSLRPRQEVVDDVSGDL